MSVDFDIYQVFDSVNTYYCSSSPLPGVAISFANQSTEIYQPKCLLKTNPDFAVDVSWISPYPEQEIIIKINHAEPIYGYHQFLKCQCNELDCPHTRASLKVVTLVDNAHVSFQSWKTAGLRAMRKQLARFQRNLGKGLLIAFMFCQNMISFSSF